MPGVVNAPFTTPNALWGATLIGATLVVVLVFTGGAALLRPSVARFLS